MVGRAKREVGEWWGLLGGVGSQDRVDGLLHLFQTLHGGWLGCPRPSLRNMRVALCHISEDNTTCQLLQVREAELESSTTDYR